MERGEKAYLGNGNWIELCDVARPVQGSHVDIPLTQLTPITVEVLRRGLLSEAEAEFILEAAADFLLTGSSRAH